MNLTEQDIIQLKKETFLFEHDFYDEEITEWLRSLKREETEQLQRIVSWTLHSKLNKEIRRVWFMIKFPKYFKEGAGFVRLEKLLKRGEELLKFDKKESNEKDSRHLVE